MIKSFLYLHIFGLIFFIYGVASLLLPQKEIISIGTMTFISSAIGLGLLFMSPYPVVKAIQWMKRQD